MSLPTWTPSELRSEAKPWEGSAWRLVEAQNIISTRKLVENVHEQNILDEILDESKPPVPEPCQHLNYLLFTPFRYQPYPYGSRFRPSGMSDGVFYAAEYPETAVTELAHYRMKFYRDSPGLAAPDNAPEYTAFQVAVKTPLALDLTANPFVQHERLWAHDSDYTQCQALALTAREAGIDVILSRSVRDPRGKKNVNILSCAAFAEPDPIQMQSWRIVANDVNATAYRQFPRLVLEFAA
ncbi:MAG: RES family NAD+ phosphorylase [Paracoccaceae bacterium]|nr:RES family NAD+ phosphorylase [Paracoccaceae bacterium]MDG2260643.1 RES family NAD+ phosphorylase [Paracoccaceae bacterium]